MKYRRQTIDFYYGSGADPRTELVAITENKNKITVDYQLYNPADEPSLHGTVEIQQKDTGLKFLSCTSKKDERLLEGGV